MILASGGHSGFIIIGSPLGLPAIFVATRKRMTHRAGFINPWVDGLVLVLPAPREKYPEMLKCSARFDCRTFDFGGLAMKPEGEEPGRSTQAL